MFGSPWAYVVAAGLALAAVGGVYQTGYNAALRKAQVANITAERDAAKADLATARDAAEFAREQAAELAASASANDVKVKELTRDLAKARDVCRLGPYARRLRDIR